MVILFSTLLTLITPEVAKLDVNALLFVRVATGLAQGVLTPAIYALLASWIPRSERGVYLALLQVGGNLGAVLTTIFSGYLCKHGFAGGWPSVFYVSGAFGVFVFLLWMYNIYNEPSQHPRISNEELLMIRLNTSAARKGPGSQVPWVAIMTSMPMWAIAVAKFCGAWGNLMLMSKLPSYLKTQLHVSIQNVSMVGFFLHSEQHPFLPTEWIHHFGSLRGSQHIVGWFRFLFRLDW